MKKRITKKNTNSKWLNEKEKREVAIIIASVFLVAFVGLILHYKTVVLTNPTGQAINPNFISEGGIKNTINNYNVIRGSGNCDTLCGTDFCIPYMADCNQNLEKNQCYCIKVPK